MAFPPAVFCHTCLQHISKVMSSPQPEQRPTAPKHFFPTSTMSRAGAIPPPFASPDLPQRPAMPVNAATPADSPNVDGSSGSDAGKLPPGPRPVGLDGPATTPLPTACT